MVLIYLALFGRIVLLGVEKIITKKVSNYDGAVVNFWWFFLSFWVYLPFATYFAIYIGIKDFSFIPYSMVASLVYCFAFIFYMKSMRLEEVSLVTPIYNFNVVFLLILAVLFLGESFTVLKLLGILLLFFGAYFLSEVKSFLTSYKNLITNKAMLYMLVCSGFLAVARIIDGFVVRSTPPIIYAISLEIFLSIYLFLYIFARKKLGEIKTMFVKSSLWTLALGVTNGISYLFLLIAFTKIEVSIADPLTMLGVIVAMILAKLIFKEKIKNRLIGAIVMVIGAFFLLYKF